MLRELRRYQCLDDDGVAFVVVESQDVIFRQTTSGVKRSDDGLKVLKLSTGAPVTMVDANTFQIVSSKKLIRVAG